MKNIVKLLGIIALVAVIGFSMAGCGGGGDSDPVIVDLSLPSITEVPSFAGTFVTNETEQLALVEDAIAALEEFTATSSGGSSPDKSIVRGISRAVYNQPLDETFINKKLADGVVANGFVTGYAKGQAANEKIPTVGDYEEISLRAKLQVDFTDVTHNYINNAGSRADYKFSGKYIYDENLYGKMNLTSTNPERASVKVNLTANNGYALSVSKGGKGLKFIMKLDANWNFEKNNMLESELDEMFKPTVKLTIEVYDNDNAKAQTKTFTDLDEASKYLGDNILDIGF